jgi:hypothetical protein
VTELQQAIESAADDCAIVYGTGGQRQVLRVVCFRRAERSEVALKLRKHEELRSTKAVIFGELSKLSCNYVADVLEVGGKRRKSRSE